jgi:predicted dehydrogenase
MTRWGILSTGKIAHAFAHALKVTPGAELVAVASRSQASADAFGEEFGITRRYGSYEAMCAAPDIDVIYVGTPHALHAENALLALDGDKAVLVEKAFTINRNEAQRVIDAARSRGLFLMEAMWTRYLPSMDEVRHIIASGEIGKVTQINADFGISGQFDAASRMVNPDLGGGALLDLGIYPLSIASFLLGEVRDVKAFAEMGPTGVDTQTTFTLRHKGGALSICTCSMRARSPIELTIAGDNGFIRMHTPFYKARMLTVETNDGKQRTVELPFLGNGYVHEAIEVQRCLAEGLVESPRMTHDETLAIMGVLDEIRKQIGLRYAADY